VPWCPWRGREEALLGRHFSGRPGRHHSSGRPACANAGGRASRQHSARRSTDSRTFPAYGFTRPSPGSTRRHLGPGPITNLSRWPQLRSDATSGTVALPPVPPGVEGVSDYDQLVGDYTNYDGDSGQFRARMILGACCKRDTVADRPARSPHRRPGPYRDRFPTGSPEEFPFDGGRPFSRGLWTARIKSRSSRAKV
jgi:hypothetical protein